MRFIALLSLLLPNLLQAQPLKKSCNHWNQINLHLTELDLETRSNLQSMFMKSKGHSSSHLLLISDEEQKSYSRCKINHTPIFESHLVCSVNGLEKAKDYAVRKKGRFFQSKVVPWDIPRQEVYWKSLDFVRGLINPNQGKIIGNIENGHNYNFGKIYAAHLKVRKGYYHIYKCKGPNEHSCIRQAHKNISDAFQELINDFPFDMRERFQKKLKLMNEIRELEWTLH